MTAKPRPLPGSFAPYLITVLASFAAVALMGSDGAGAPPATRAAAAGASDGATAFGPLSLSCSSACACNRRAAAAFASYGRCATVLHGRRE